MATKQKILIVDDDENIAELISLYLTNVLKQRLFMTAKVPCSSLTLSARTSFYWT